MHITQYHHNKISSNHLTCYHLHKGEIYQCLSLLAHSGKVFFLIQVTHTNTAQKEHKNGSFSKLKLVNDDYENHKVVNIRQSNT
jgi:hypothetical protein